MSLILHLETATTVCSVALSYDGKLIALKEENKGYTHAEHLSLFIEEAMHSAGKKVHEIDAVAVSMGPGSYTGLRIGVATAKGICFGINKPLIAVNTLLSFAVLAALKHQKKYYYCPMLDARRMEVYTCLIDEGNMIGDTEAMILTAQSYEEVLNENEIIFFGDGAQKFKPICHHAHAIFDLNIQPSSTGMIDVAYSKYKAQQFENTAYFEPYYLKEFYTPLPKASS